MLMFVSAAAVTVFSVVFVIYLGEQSALYLDRREVSLGKRAAKYSLLARAK